VDDNSAPPNGSMNLLNPKTPDGGVPNVLDPAKPASPAATPINP